MWDRKELKANGKAAFKANYWKCVLVALILTALVGGGVAASGNRVNDTTEADGTALVEELQNAPKEVIGVIAAMLVGVFMVSCVVKLLVFNPLQVGCKRFFLANSDAPAELGELGYGFKNGYGSVVGAMFLRDLFIGLWGLLFVVPGIIKAYSYRMVPYILAENPGIGATEAITRSRQMMDGHKWNTFVLDLSFLGWYFLAALTLGLVNVFWTEPYSEATNAELYKAIR